MTKQTYVMNDKNLLLVNAVKRFQCLYNFSIPEYTKKEETESAWAEVANNMQQSVQECKEKWRNLRYSFLRSLKPNADGSSKKKYYLHNKMEFLIPFMKTRFEGALVPSYDEFSDEENIINEEDVAVNEDKLDLSTFEFQNAEPHRKRRKITSYKYTSTKDVGASECPRKMFLLGLLPEINNLTEVQMKVFRRKVLSLLDEITQDVTIVLDEDSNRSSIEDNRQEFPREFITTIKAEPID